MQKEYDFSNAKRAKDVPHLAKLQAEAARGKTRITILIDDDVLAAFRERAEAEGKGYQTLINSTLRASVTPESAPVTVEALRRVLREELGSGATEAEGRRPAARPRRSRGTELAPSR